MGDRKLPHLGNGGVGVNRMCEEGDRTQFLLTWFDRLCVRLREVRVAVGDYKRVLTPIVTTRHGITGVFLDPPYTEGAMEYAVSGRQGEVAREVRGWCGEHGANPDLRIVLCGHTGEHEDLLQKGWRLIPGTARGGYGITEQGQENTDRDSLYLSPHCLFEKEKEWNLFECVDG